jgi:hypothetical protein
MSRITAGDLARYILDNIDGDYTDDIGSISGRDVTGEGDLLIEVSASPDHDRDDDQTFTVHVEVY